MTSAQIKDKASYKKEEVIDVQMLLIWHQYHHRNKCWYNFECNSICINMAAQKEIKIGNFSENSLVLEFFFSDFCNQMNSNSK